MSKILLLGEYSGLHKNLKNGLTELGHTVKVASEKDGKKNIANDLILTPSSKTKVGKFLELGEIFKEFKGYDIVQFINPYITHKIVSFYYDKIFRNNDKIFCLAAGDDVEFINFTLSGKMKKYSPFDEYIFNNELKTKDLPYTTHLDHYLHNRFMKKIDRVIPIMWEYAESYRSSNYAHKLTNTIPLPINTDSIKYEKNKVENKVVFLSCIE